jgi:hypothetical protein
LPTGAAIGADADVERFQWRRQTGSSAVESQTAAVLADRSSACVRSEVRLPPPVVIDDGKAA